jgi:hypothetical protein
MENSYKHIFLIGNASSEKYKAAPSRGAIPRIPIRERSSQSRKLLRQFDAIWQEKTRIQQQREAEQIATRQGTYISFTSAADHDLITKSLEDLRKGIRLLNIKEIPVGEKSETDEGNSICPKRKRRTFYFENPKVPTGRNC